MTRDTREFLVRIVAIVGLWAGIIYGLQHQQNYIGWGIFVTFLIVTA